MGSVLRKVEYPLPRGMQANFIPVYSWWKRWLRPPTLKYNLAIFLWSLVNTKLVALTVLFLFCFFISDCSITKFLNRILGLEVHKQNYLFQYFTDNFDYLIEKDKKEGKYDMGILGTEVKCNSKIQNFRFYLEEQYVILIVNIMVTTIPQGKKTWEWYLLSL